MIVTLLCIAFSKTLSFADLTLPVMFDWYCNHPFLFLLAIVEMLRFNINIKYKEV